MPRDEREHALHLLVLAGDRVDERLALVDGEAGLERLDDRRVDRERHVRDRLHELDRVREDRRLVGERDAGVDVEHLRARLDLRDRVGDDGVEVAGRHLLGELLAAGRVDPLADDDERPVEADHDLLVAEDSSVSVTRSPLSARADEPLEDVVGVGASSHSASCVDLGLEVVAARPRLAAPLLEVRVGADQPGAHRRGVDRLLEARSSSARGARAALASPSPGPGCRATRSRSAQAATAPRRSASATGRARRSRCAAARTRARGTRPPPRRAGRAPASSVCAR